MTWTSFHSRGETLRDVIDAVDARRDGRLPHDLPGVSACFDDDLDLVGALQLRWHTRLAGRIERALSDQPMRLEDAVVSAWVHTATEMPGVRAVIDRHVAEPTDDRMAEALAKALAKERVLLAAMSGRSGTTGPQAVAVGARIEERARAAYAATGARDSRPRGLLDRLRAALAA